MHTINLSEAHRKHTVAPEQRRPPVLLKTLVQCRLQLVGSSNVLHSGRGRNFTERWAFWPQPLAQQDTIQDRPTVLCNIPATWNQIPKTKETEYASERKPWPKRKTSSLAIICTEHSTPMEVAVDQKSYLLSTLSTKPHQRRPGNNILMSYLQIDKKKPRWTMLQMRTGVRMITCVVRPRIPHFSVFANLTCQIHQTNWWGQIHHTNSVDEQKEPVNSWTELVSFTFATQSTHYDNHAQEWAAVNSAREENKFLFHRCTSILFVPKTICRPPTLWQLQKVLFAPGEPRISGTLWRGWEQQVPYAVFWTGWTKAIPPHVYHRNPTGSGKMHNNLSVFFFCKLNPTADSSERERTRCGPPVNSFATHTWPDTIFHSNLFRAKTHLKAFLREVLRNMKIARFLQCKQCFVNNRQPSRSPATFQTSIPRVKQKFSHIRVHTNQACSLDLKTTFKESNEVNGLWERCLAFLPLLPCQKRAPTGANGASTLTGLTCLSLQISSRSSETHEPTQGTAEWNGHCGQNNCCVLLTHRCSVFLPQCAK